MRLGEGRAPAPPELVPAALPPRRVDEVAPVRRRFPQDDEEPHQADQDACEGEGREEEERPVHASQPPSPPNRRATPTREVLSSQHRRGHDPIGSTPDFPFEGGGAPALRNWPVCLIAPGSTAAYRGDKPEGGGHPLRPRGAPEGWSLSERRRGGPWGVDGAVPGAVGHHPVAGGPGV